MEALGGNANIQQCILQEASLKGGFDMVTIWDVLEHVTSPTEFLRSAAAQLRPGGYLVLNVPRIDSMASRLLKGRWPVLLAEHLCYFTVPSLSACGEAASLRLVHTGQRPAAFSLRYIFYRASQHQIPGSALVGRVLSAARASDWSIPVWIGEIYAVFKKE
jgi:hypothetical protein